MGSWKGERETVGWRDGQETIRTRVATSSLLDTTAHSQPLRIPSAVPFDFAPSGSSLRASPEPTVLALICIRPIMSSDSPSHPRRHTSRPSIKPRLFLLQLTPHFTTQIGRLRAGGCSLVTTPYTYVSYARTLTLCGSAAVENLANERFSFYR